MWYNTSGFEKNLLRKGRVFLKFSVGYPSVRNDRFIERILECRERIAEVYFAFGDIPNGRSPQSEAYSEPPWRAVERQLSDLRRFANAGIRLNLLLNAACYGDDALSRAFFMKLGDSMDQLSSEFPLGAVTTTSPLIGKFTHANFPDVEVRASVNIGIGTPAAVDYVSEYFDSFYAKRELNRDIAALKRLREHCRKKGKGLCILANSGCMNDCSAHIFHDSLVAHEKGLSARDNAYEFVGVCREFLKKPENRVSVIRDMNYIRPEDINIYEGLADCVKLATRVNRDPIRVLDAYVSGRYSGPLTGLLEPDNGQSLLPEIVENSRFPENFGERVSSCKKDCANCGFCDDVYEKVRVRLDTDIAGL